MSKSISETLATYATGLKFTDLPPQVIQQAKSCILDIVGCTWAGAHTDMGKKLIELAVINGGPGNTSIVGSNLKTSAWSGGFANGFNANIESLDDVYEGSYYHPGATAISSALAVAEAENCSGKDLIVAVVASYEIAIRIALAINPSHYEYWHTTGTVGTFAAAIAASLLLGLSEQQIVWALGNAGTQASGLGQYAEDGAMSKPLHPANAVKNGLTAAYLAKANFTGAKHIFEGDKGFGAATAKEVDNQLYTAGLGEHYLILEVSPKQHASCFYTHPTINASLKLRETLQEKINAIDKVVIYTDKTSAQVSSRTEVSEAHHGKFSMGFCFSLGMVVGRVGRDEFLPEALNNPEVRELFAKTSVVVETSFSEGFPRRKRSKVEVTLTDGTVITEKIDTNGGHPLTFTEVTDKVRYVIGMDEPTLNTLTTGLKQLESITGLKDYWKTFADMDEADYDR